MGQSGDNSKTLWITTKTLSYIQAFFSKLFRDLLLINLKFFIVFIGEYKHTIDPKNRMTIPSKFQGQLTDGAIITRGLDNCLFVFTNEEWKRVAEQIKQQSFTTANARAFSRLMLAGAMDVKLDTQGRILIPSYLSDYASLGQKVVVAGLYDRLEIWNENAWETYKKQTEANANEISEQMSNLGI